MEGMAGEKGRDREWKERVRNREGGRGRGSDTPRRACKEKQKHKDRVAGGGRQPEQEMGSEWADPMLETQGH